MLCVLTREKEREKNIHMYIPLPVFCNIKILNGETSSRPSHRYFKDVLYVSFICTECCNVLYSRRKKRWWKEFYLPFATSGLVSQSTSISLKTPYNLLLETVANARTTALWNQFKHYFFTNWNTSHVLYLVILLQRIEDRYFQLTERIAFQTFSSVIGLGIDVISSKFVRYPISALLGHKYTFGRLPLICKRG